MDCQRRTAGVGWKSVIEAAPQQFSKKKTPRRAP